MSPDTVEALTIAVSVSATVAFAGVGGYLAYRFLEACDHIALIKDKLCDEEKKDE